MFGQELRTLTDEATQLLANNPFHQLEKELKSIAQRGERYHSINAIAKVRDNEENWQERINLELEKWKQWAKANELNAKIERNWGGFDSPILYYWSVTLTW